MSDNVDNEAPAPGPSGAGTGDTPAPPSPPTAGDEPSGNDELKAFMEEYRADKRAAAEAAEVKAKADAEAAAKKKVVPAPEPKKKAKPPEPPESKPTEADDSPKGYGSARWFNRKPKRVKE